jgi:hypothetical protein
MPILLFFLTYRIRKETACSGKTAIRRRNFKGGLAKGSWLIQIAGVRRKNRAGSLLTGSAQKMAIKPGGASETRHAKIRKIDK